MDISGIKCRRLVVASISCGVFLERGCLLPPSAVGRALSVCPRDPSGRAAVGLSADLGGKLV